MTRTTNARIAGFTYLFYAAIGICSELLMHQARGVEVTPRTRTHRPVCDKRAPGYPDYAARMPSRPSCWP